MNEESRAEKPIKIPQELTEKLVTGEISMGQFVGLSESAQYAIANIAHQSLESGQADKALAIYEGLVAASPLDSVFHCHLGSTYYALNDLDKAFEHYSNAIRFNKANVDALAGRGELFLRRKQLVQAADDFQAAIKADPQGQHRSTIRARAALSMLAKAAEQAEQGSDAPGHAAKP